MQIFYIDDTVVLYVKFAFSACSVCVSTIIQILSEFLICFHDILHNISSDQGANFVTVNAHQHTRDCDPVVICVLHHIK